jgi:NADH-quinone oxidoreductase subunit M
MAALGLPGLNNFVGEVLILIGTYRVRPVAAIFGFVALLFGVIYVLRMVQEALFGEFRGEQSALKDLDSREIVILAALALSVLFLGLFPKPVLGLFEEPINGLIKVVMPTGA